MTRSETLALLIPASASLLFPSCIIDYKDQKYVNSRRTTQSVHPAIDEDLNVGIEGTDHGVSVPLLAARSRVRGPFGINVTMLTKHQFQKLTLKKLKLDCEDHHLSLISADQPIHLNAKYNRYGVASLRHTFHDAFDFVPKDPNSQIRLTLAGSISAKGRDHAFTLTYTYAFSNFRLLKIASFNDLMGI